MNIDFDFKSIISNGISINSSGTSGVPSLFFQTPEKIKAANIVAIDSQKITKSSRIYTCCKITHAGGLFAQTIPALHIGAHVDIVKFDAYKFVKDIKNYTHTHITPLHAKAIMLTKGFKTLDLSNIWITCGADPVTNDIIKAFVSKGATFMVNWGMSEIGPIAINKTFRNIEEIDSTNIDKSTVLGDTFWCDWKIDQNELVVKGDICIFDNWYYTKDIVFLKNNVLYFKGRTNKEIDIWFPKKG
jgi:acyl-CoA synthetase (AMP-forming)/AMP-acid ligase II